MESLKVFIYPRSGKEHELQQTCELITEQSRGEVGCIGCNVFKKSNDENYIMLEQEWETRNLLDDYFRSDHFTALWGALKWLGNAYEVRINDGSSQEGLSAVEKARKA